jgi:peptidoglycan/xylan/chitin deacetylase (PgdA/CDA1 family)
VVALTFDDGPDAAWTPQVLDALDAAEAKATFFVVGEQIEATAGAELLAEAVRRGHTIQMHCASHLPHESLQLEELRADRERIETVLAAYGVPAPSLWRPPYGSIHELHSCRVAAERGRQLIRWTYDPRDYRGLPAAAMLQHAREAPLREDSIVLLHDSRRYSSTPEGGAVGTVELIGPLVEHVRGMGWELTTLREQITAPSRPTSDEAFLLPCAAIGWRSARLSSGSAKVDESLRNCS